MPRKVKKSTNNLSRLYDLVFLQKIRDIKPSKEEPKKTLTNTKK